MGAHLDSEMQPLLAIRPSRAQDPSTSLCDTCQALFIQKWTIQKLCTKGGLQFKRQLSSLLTSALDSCMLCRDLLFILQDYSKLLARVYRAAGFPGRRYKDDWASTLANIKSAPSPGLFSKYVRHRDSEICFSIRGDVSSSPIIEISHHRSLHFTKSLKFEITTTEDDPTAKHILGRIIKTDLMDQRTYLKIQRWLYTCSTCHTTCSTDSNSSDPRPNFLLDVFPLKAPANTVRLKRVEGRPLGYVALSYCWGTSQPNATTKSNLDEYLHCIQISSLPLSIQDAITVTRKLRLRYLWVDSMCTIQDSEEDMAHGIGRMGSIYSNAYVTISAAHASNCNAGFLEARKLPRRCFSMPFCAESGEMGRVALNAGWEERDYYFSKYEVPLEARAWTFQESFMSPRLLIYSKYQLFWACCEDWGLDGGKTTRAHLFPDELSARTMKHPRVSDWPAVIEDFSRKELTDPSDKLPALSSIAGYFAKHINDTYLAGLWASELLEQLCWTSSCRRPPTWRAPSWSFMSIDGIVSFKKKRNIDFKGWDSGPFFKRVGPSIISYDVVPLSAKAPFGQVKSGFIEIRGRLLQTRIYPAFDFVKKVDGFGAGRMTPFVVTDSKQREHNWGALHFDSSYHRGYHTNYGKLDSDPLWCILLCMERHTIHYTALPGPGGGEKEYDVWLPWGLILAKLPNQTYHRVGYFTSLPKLTRAFLSKAPQTIIIV